MSLHIPARGRLAAVLRSFGFIVLAVSAPISAALADDAADRTFIQRLVARQIIAGVSVSGDTATIQALPPFAGADNGSMSDVANVVLRVQTAAAQAQGKPPTVVKVVVRHPDGRVIATYSESTGLVRG